MKKLFVLCLAAGLGLFFIAASPGNGKVQAGKVPLAAVAEAGVQPSSLVKREADFGNIPLYFIPNKGQVDEKAKFYARTSRYTLWMTKEGLVFETTLPAARFNRDVSRLFFLNANKNPQMAAVDETKHKVNYFKGKDRSKWRTGIQTAKAVLYKGIYRNIDLKVYGLEKEVEYDWLVKPGGVPGAIRFKYENALTTSIDKEGNLVVETNFGQLVHKKPVCYQLIKGEKREIQSGFKKTGVNIYGFEVGNYDKDCELVIDPVVSLDYSTYLGGSGREYAPKIDVDKSGHIYVTGYTLSDNFPRLNAYSYVRAGSYDVFVTKFGPTGENLLFSTYFGGSSSDRARDIAVSKEGDIYITGYTTSTDLPAINNSLGLTDAFVAKFNGEGYLMGGCYVGGTSSDTGSALAIDGSNNVFITGTTRSGSFRLYNPFQHTISGSAAFVCRLNPDLTHVEYATFLGGSNHDYGVDIVVDKSGYFYVAGYTWSSNFPKGFAGNVLSTGGKGDIFVCKFKPDGSNLVYSAVWGGSLDDFLTALALDNSGSAYVTGYTWSNDFPVENAFQENKKGNYDVFISKLNGTGSDLVYSTYLGGTDDEKHPAFLTVDNTGNAYVAGTTKSYNFPRKHALQKTMNGWQDVFFTVMAPNGSGLIYSSFLGGSDDNYPPYYSECSGIAMDKAGNIYITGTTNSNNFPVKDPYQAYNKGDWDVFISRFSLSGVMTVQSSPDPGVPITVSPADKNGNGSGNTSFTRTYNLGKIVTLTAPGTFNGKSFSRWTIDGTDNFNRTVHVPVSGDPTVTAVYGTPSSTGISLDRTRMNFGVSTSGTATGSQFLFIANSGSGTLDWTLSDDASWLHCSPSSGTGSGQVTVTVNGGGLPAGAYNGTITVTSANAANSPQTVAVTMTVYNAGSTAAPFGYFEAPVDGATVGGNIAVTGWALDNIEVTAVKIYFENNGGLVYIGDAVFVEGARPDVQQAYPDYPKNSQAGWGYMLLTNMLPDGGNGTFILHAIARDKEGHRVTLGTKTIICDNANAVKPFGAIDTPAQGGTASGGNYRNQGWVLTPPPNKIPVDGSTINVYVDGVKLGNPKYNIYRPDVAGLFPGYANSNGAAAYFDFDTTAYANGVHTIFWTAFDNAGNGDGIGSRYFTIRNSAEQDMASNVQPSTFNVTPGKIPVDYFGSAAVKKGYHPDTRAVEVYPDDKGIITIEMREMERLEIRFFGIDPGAGVSTSTVLNLSPLPIGSTLDSKRGVFYWTPGPGFIGRYQLIFIEKDLYGEMTKKQIDVKIVPKFKK